MTQELVDRARADLRDGRSPAASEAIQALILERHTLRASYDTVKQQIESRQVGRTPTARQRAGRVAQLQRPAESEGLGPVADVLELQDKLSTAVSRGDRQGVAASVLRRLEREVDAALQTVQRSEPRRSSVTRRQPPEVRRDPVPISELSVGALAPVDVTSWRSSHGERGTSQDPAAGA